MSSILSSVELEILIAQIKKYKLISIPNEIIIACIIRNLKINTDITRTPNEIIQNIKMLFNISKEYSSNMQQQCQHQQQQYSNIRIYLDSSQLSQHSIFSQQQLFNGNFQPYKQNKQYQLKIQNQKNNQNNFQNGQINIYHCKRLIKPTKLIQDYPTLIENKILLKQQHNNNNNNNNNIQQQQCHLLYDSKIKYLNICDEMKWIYHQYFYSNFDRIYFKQDQMFKNIILELNLQPTEMNFKQYKIIHQALPYPKLFTLDYIIYQQKKLNDFRKQIRQLPQMKCKNDDINFTVNKQIIALHPICGHLHSGIILAIYKQNQYMVKFIRPQLGAQKILDINMCSKQNNNCNKLTIDHVNYEILALTIKLLEYKSELLKKLKEYNKYAEQINNCENMNRMDIKLNNKFLQEYGWIGSTINILSLGLRNIIANFRLRGVSSYNQQSVSKYFSSLLLNPLNLMEKQLQSSQEPIDVNYAYKIKDIFKNHKQIKIDENLNNILNKKQQSIKQINFETKNLIKNCIGILISLKYEGKRFNIQNNKYLHELAQIINGILPEYFNEIYQKLHIINKKINQN